jgi:hypothetical protein
MGGSPRIACLSDAERCRFPSTSSSALVTFFCFLRARGGGSSESSMKSSSERFTFAFEAYTMVVEVQRCTNKAKVSNALENSNVTPISAPFGDKSKSYQRTLHPSRQTVKDLHWISCSQIGVPHSSLLVDIARKSFSARQDVVRMFSRRLPVEKR